MLFSKKYIKKFLVVILSLFSLPVISSTVGFKAVIGTNISSCSVAIPESNLSFRPLQFKNITGSVTTYEIKPLQIITTCSKGGGVVNPSLKLQGNTPYSGNDTVFLDGSTNGVGFMLRRISSGVPSLADFYDTGKALDNNVTSINLSPLNDDNKYYVEENLWVGLVGSLGSPIVPGPFSSTIIINISFQ